MINLWKMQWTFVENVQKIENYLIFVPQYSIIRKDIYTLQAVHSICVEKEIQNEGKIF